MPRRKESLRTRSTEAGTENGRASNDSCSGTALSARRKPCRIGGQARGGMAAAVMRRKIIPFRVDALRQRREPQGGSCAIGIAIMF